MVPTTAAEGWRGAELDLAAYLRRIGYEGDTAPTVPVLRALHRAHVESIPFENLEIILGRGLQVDLDSVRRKLVAAPRGGYCFEHTALFAAALERLGFGAVAMMARVSMGSDSLRPNAHAVLRVTTGDDDRVWLADVGFGSGPLEPLELRDGARSEQDGWRYAVERFTGELDVPVWVVHEHGAEGWVDRHGTWQVPQYPIDFKVANHFVSTDPHSPFTQRPIVQRFSARAHESLDGTTWSTLSPDGTRTKREITQAEVPELLAEVFGVGLTPDDAATLRRWTPAAAPE